jgi:glutamine synthetase
VMERMARRTYLPVISAYSTKVAKGITTVAAVLPDAPQPYETRELAALIKGVNDTYAAVDRLAEVHQKAEAAADSQEQANIYASEVVPAMDELRAAIDSMEPIVSNDYWPVPTYNDILFYV